jgi:hypothetical protein
MSKDNPLIGLRLSRVIAEVQHDRAWTNTTPDEQLAEVLRRLGDDAVEAFADARAALVADMEVRLLSTIDWGEPSERDKPPGK